MSGAWGWILFAFLAGWLLGVVMSWRQVLKARKLQQAAAGVLAKRVWDLLNTIGAIKITVVEDDVELEVDESKLTELLRGDLGTKH